MLILTRRPGESIMIENNDAVAKEVSNDESESVTLGVGKALITITILRVKGGQISLGIDAPPSISIFREEIYRKRDNQNGNALQSQYTNHYGPDPSEEEEGYY